MLEFSYLKIRKAASSFWKNEKGIGTLEIVLIAAVLIMVALLFKDWIMAFIDEMMTSVEGKAKDVFN
jgi:hypothetical protein